MSRIGRWGNSHAVRLPRDVLDAAGIAPDADVKLSAEPGRIVVAPVRRKPSLDELLARLKPGSSTEEIDYGRPVGREVL
jgi:antitoxin MazE